KEFGEGGKGISIAGQDYALWFSKEGFRIAPGRSAYGPGSTLIPWVSAAAMTANLLRDGTFAAQDRINAARDNEFRELAETLWFLRRDFSEEAKETDHLAAIAKAYAEPGFPEGTKAIEKVLRIPEEREKLKQDMQQFDAAYRDNHNLLRFRRSPNSVDLYSRIADMDRPVTVFRAVDGFAPAKASFVTEDEMNQLLAGGPSISESKLQIYSYFVQGHNEKECAGFLRESYGTGGITRTGYDEWHDSKGIRMTRSDETSGFKGYDTVQLNWYQVEKRIRGLIDSGRYLNEQERAYLPAYDKLTLARKIYAFQYNDPNKLPDRQNWDTEIAKRDILPLLDDPEKSAALYEDMTKALAVLSPDSKEYQQMEPALQDMGAFQRGEYSLFTPLPEEVLRAERQAKRAAKENRKDNTSKRPDSKTPDVPGDRLAEAARALAKKMQKDTNITEDEDGQITLDFSAAPTAESQNPPVPPPNTDSFSPESEKTSDQPNTKRKESAAQYDLSYGFLGNGLTVWNLLEKEDGDYKTVAHIAPDRTVNFYDPNMPEEIRKQIQKAALTSDARISATQDTPVFSVPPRVLTQEQAAEYNAIKETHPDTIVLYQMGDSYEMYGEDAQIAASLLGLDVTSRIILDGWQVEMCSIPSQKFKQYVEKLEESHTITLALYDPKEEKHKTATLETINAPAKEAPEVSAPKKEPTIRELYDHYVPIIKNLVLADAAYQNACVNSDKENAYLEGREAILRAVHTIEDPAFQRQFFDNATFFTRLHHNVLDSTYPILSQSRQEHEQDKSDDDLDTVPYNFELEYRMLSRLKSDCEYFLGAGGYAEKHLSEGSIAAQIAKMRELYNTIPEKPEWLTAEDIDRYEQRMTAPEHGREWTVSPVTLYRDALEWIDREINRGGWMYEQLRDRSTDYDGAKAALESELYAYLKHVAFGDTDMMAAYHTLPKFREWLIEDLLERNYQDVAIDPRDALERYADSPEVPEWAKDAPPAPEKKYVTLSAKGPLKRPEPAPQAQESVPPAPVQPENAAAASSHTVLDPKLLAPAYKIGDTVYLENSPYIISNITLHGIQPRDPNTERPVFKHEDRDRFENDLGQDSRNSEIVRFLSIDWERIRRFPKEILTAHLLNEHDRNMISRWFCSGKDNRQIAELLSELLSDRSGSVVLSDHVPTSYSADAIGPKVTRRQRTYYSTWEQNAAIFRFLWQKELDGFSYEPPAVDYSEPERAGDSIETPPAAETVPEPTGAGALEEPENAFAATAEPDLTLNVAAPVISFDDAMEILGRAVKNSSLHRHLCDHELDYDSAVEALNAEMPQLMETLKGYPYFMEVYQSTPIFRELLVEEILDRNYPDVEPNLTPNVDEYLNLKAQHPDKLVGVQVGEYMLFYGKDAEVVSPALDNELLTREIPGLGETSVSGYRGAWQAALKKLLEHGQSVVLAQPDPERGPDAPYEIIKERDIADYIPLGMELTIDGRRMKIDSVDFQAGTVSLMDLDTKGLFPIFHPMPVPVVREFVEQVQQSEEYIAAEVAAQLKKDEAAEKVAGVSKEPETAVPASAQPEPEQIEIDGGQIVPPPVLRQPSQNRLNFQITDNNLGVGGEKTKYQYNVAAIRALKQIETEGRLATPEEQETLSRYVGWGGIASAFDPNDSKWAKEYAELKELLTPEEYTSARSTVLNAHYTSPTVIKAMYQAVERMDFQPGTVLEPSMGVGNFFGLLPEKLADSRLYGVELDDLTGRIARQLYQKADITISGFETSGQRDFYDLAVGNVPFGNYQVNDPAYNKLGFNIHN
ncbi:MAG: hypothetical protein K2O18_09045, partial [Oscillospiraceae bacterium]|nr:hypothetical protein [Oscillospiraceae bacterium]